MFPDGKGISGPISVSEVGSDARRVVGRPNSTLSEGKPLRPSDRQPSGLGKGVGDRGRCEPAREKSKVKEEEQFHE